MERPETRGPLRPAALLALAAAIGTSVIVLLLLLPDLIRAIPREIRSVLEHPLLKVAALAIVLLVGPARMASAIRGRLSGRFRFGAWTRLACRVGRACQPTRADELASFVLRGPLTAAVALACALMVLSWAPHYLTWPWWPDTDQFAVSALSWHAGVVPYRDLADFDFPGPIYLFYLLGLIFGWGKELPFNAADALFVIVLGVALSAWSRRLFGSALPGLVSYVPFLCYYLDLDYTLVGQRDWHAPFLAVLGLLALQAFPGRVGRFTSAPLLAFALVYRPQAIVFLPATALAVIDNARLGDETTARRSILALVEWGIAYALSLLIAFSPLIIAGALDDFVHSLRHVRPGSHYYRNNWDVFRRSLDEQLLDPFTASVFAANLFVLAAGPPSLRRSSRVWTMALLGVLFYRLIGPEQHAYMQQPLVLVRSINLVALVAWPLGAPRLAPVLRVAAVALALMAGSPHIPKYCLPSQSIPALEYLLRGETPPVPPPGCDHMFTDGQIGGGSYNWKDYHSLLDYLRTSTSEQTRVAMFLRASPLPSVNGPAGRLTTFPAAGGFLYLWLVDPSMEDEYVESLERTEDSVVVWTPGFETVEGLRFPRLVGAIEVWYRPQARFGNIEVWRHIHLAPKVTEHRHP